MIKDNKTKNKKSIKLQKTDKPKTVKTVSVKKITSNLNAIQKIINSGSLESQ